VSTCTPALCMPNAVKAQECAYEPAANATVCTDFKTVCECKAGYQMNNGGGEFDKTEGKYEGTCAVVKCPAGTVVDVSDPTHCDCSRKSHYGPGYDWSSEDTSFEALEQPGVGGDEPVWGCNKRNCPRNSVDATSDHTGNLTCQCMAGFSGTVTYNETTFMWNASSCALKAPETCPGNTVASAGKCVCAANFDGYVAYEEPAMTACWLAYMTGPAYYCDYDAAVVAAKTQKQKPVDYCYQNTLTAVIHAP